MIGIFEQQAVGRSGGVGGRRTSSATLSDSHLEARSLNAVEIGFFMDRRYEQHENTSSTRSVCRLAAKPPPRQ